MLICMYNVSILHQPLWNLQRIVGLPPQGLRVHALMSLGGNDLCGRNRPVVSVLRLWYLDVRLEVRINGLFHLLIKGVYWGYNPLTNHLLTSWDIQVVDPYLMPEIMSHGTNDSHTCLRILSFQIGARLCLVFVQDSHSS